MTAKERSLTKRLDELEKRIKQLEEEPREVHHHHYPVPQPIYVHLWTHYPAPTWWQPATITVTPNTTWTIYNGSGASVQTTGFCQTMNTSLSDATTTQSYSYNLNSGVQS